MEKIIISFIIIALSIIIYIIFKRHSNKRINNKNRKELLSKFNIDITSFNKTPFETLYEEDHVTCFLSLKNKDFLSGQMNGMISYYNGQTYKPIILIIEHCEPVTSLFQLKDETILTSSADGTMKKIRMLLNKENRKKYLVEFVFYTNKEFIFKSIQLKNNDDILSCNISKELILWKKNPTKDNPLYKVENVLLNSEYIRDILQINESYFITCGETLQCWDCHNYKLFKRLLYNCKGNNSLYKLNDEYTAILLEKNGEVLLFNNKTLSEVKLFNLTNFTISYMKYLSNNVLVLGIYDSQSKKNIINQYIIKNENNEIKLIEIINENIGNNNKKSEKNWERINVIEEVENKIYIGFGGEENEKFFGKIMIFDNI